MKLKLFYAGLLCALSLCGCSSVERVGKLEPRTGDEIVVAGQFFHTGTPVVLWLDPGGYDAYRVERRFAPIEKSDWSNSTVEVKTLKTPNRFGLREKNLTTNEIEQVRGGGWDLPLLQSVVDQFVLHFDDAGLSRTCFLVLQDDRDLSVHFMCDLDGTIYQTLDLKERAWQATIANDRSVGVEIANIGAYPVNGKIRSRSGTGPMRMAKWSSASPAVWAMAASVSRTSPAIPRATKWCAVSSRARIWCSSITRPSSMRR